MDLIDRHDEIVELRRRHPAWALLRAGTAPLVLVFLGAVFVEENTRSVSRSELIGRLEEFLQGLRSETGDDGAVRYARSAKEYLDDWAAPETGWLRAYYPPGADEQSYDATPAVEKSLSWLRTLQPAPFVGTESRLNTVVDLLRQMAFGAELDPQVRLAELHRRRTEIQQQIDDVEAGRLDVLDDVAQRDRYQQFTSTARELLADFRQVEENFRALDRGLREKIATWDGGKGELLDEVLGDRRGIADSDQGRSFRGFYDFLLSASRQDEFTDLLGRVLALPEIAGSDSWARHIHHDWLDAAGRTQSTVRQLSDQLRRFLDDQVWLENRRVMEVLHEIEVHALAVRDLAPGARSAPVPGSSVPSPEIPVVLPTERPLYRPRRRLALDSDGIAAATERADPAALYEQVYVDVARLRAAVADRLAREPVAALADIVADHPLEQGLAELIGYLSVQEGVATSFDPEQVDAVSWTGSDDVDRTAQVPRVVYTRVVERSNGGAPA
ncbi:DUF3375 domain-containing protein [Klenkia sp. LSe6-5]|uniref:DUF3375 domain-containing protein n=1 Tax=Klenkia sesuvii TaxID=3103137 RepID=A0ABU8DTG6_9ACTN